MKNDDTIYQIRLFSTVDNEPCQPWQDVSKDLYDEKKVAVGERWRYETRVLYTAPQGAKPAQPVDAVDVPTALRFAADVIDLYDDAAMHSDYMITATEAADVVRVLAERAALDHPRPTAARAPCPGCGGARGRLGPSMGYVPCDDCDGVGFIESDENDVAPTGEQAEEMSWYFVSIDDDGRPSVTYCPSPGAIELAVREWMGGDPDAECLSDDDEDMARGVRDELLQHGVFRPEGDPPCYLLPAAMPEVQS